ncbi:MAG TPA: NAD-dependent epimerase/dehydratase family protein [Candidatus Limnocylindrales bacterium]|nr:NAD-dependent epimerase/dehydratase family protein [Candidatus Limnocylindrales bacterium]
MSRLVLITGGAGFIGANLARLLVGRGDRLRVLDDLSIGRRDYLAGVSHELVEATLSDAAAVAAAVEGADAVVHLAARAGIPDSVTDPLGTFAVNVAQTLGLLDAARRAGVRRFVFASSNAAVGDHEPPSDELQLAHPVSPYGASKLAGEAYCQAYAATYGLAACALRFSNAYGPYSLHKKSVVAAWLRAALAGAPVTIHGDGGQTRDFVFAGDLARAVLAALDAPEERVAGEVFQAGTGRETTVNELATAIGRAVGRPLAIHHGPAREGDVRRNVSRVDKAAERLGYRAQVGLDEGLRRTADWFAAALADPALAGVTAHAASGSE